AAVSNSRFRDSGRLDHPGGARTAHAIDVQVDSSSIRIEWPSQPGRPGVVRRHAVPRRKVFYTKAELVAPLDDEGNLLPGQIAHPNIKRAARPIESSVLPVIGAGQGNVAIVFLAKSGSQHREALLKLCWIERPSLGIAVGFSDV